MTILSPLCLVHIYAYHQRNYQSFGQTAQKNLFKSLWKQKSYFTVGLLYAIPHQVSFRIEMCVPIATSAVASQEVITRALQYEQLRLRKGQGLQNHYEQFILIGWYCLGRLSTNQYQAYHNNLGQFLKERAAPYFLQVEEQGEVEPLLFLDGKMQKYEATISPVEKQCTDTLLMQDAGDALLKKMHTQLALVKTFNDKIIQMKEALRTGLQTKQIKIIQWIENYQRVQAHSGKTKNKIIDAINYSLLEGIILKNKK